MSGMTRDSGFLHGHFCQRLVSHKPPDPTELPVAYNEAAQLQVGPCWSHVVLGRPCGQGSIGDPGILQI